MDGYAASTDWHRFDPDNVGLKNLPPECAVGRL